MSRRHRERPRLTATQKVLRRATEAGFGDAIGRAWIAMSGITSPEAQMFCLDALRTFEDFVGERLEEADFDAIHAFRPDDEDEDAWDGRPGWYGIAAASFGTNFRAETEKGVEDSYLADIRKLEKDR